MVVFPASVSARVLGGGRHRVDRPACHVQPGDPAKAVVELTFVVVLDLINRLVISSRFLNSRLTTG